MLFVYILIAVLCCVCAYLLCGLNPAIILSKKIYGRDIRNEGSGNAGFTNFKRVFGSKYAWWVFAIDLLKSAAVFALCGGVFAAFGLGWINGVWCSGVCGLLGHAYPVWYEMKGGKGFLCCLSLAFLLDWRCGLLAFGVMALIVLTVRIMSLATLSGLLGAAVLMWFVCPSLPARVAFTACVVFVWVRHRENLARLVKGKESRFSFGGRTRD